MEGMARSEWAQERHLIAHSKNVDGNDAEACKAALESLQKKEYVLMCARLLNFVMAYGFNNTPVDKLTEISKNFVEQIPMLG